MLPSSKGRFLSSAVMVHTKPQKQYTQEPNTPQVRNITLFYKGTLIMISGIFLNEGVLGRRKRGTCGLSHKRMIAKSGLKITTATKISSVCVCVRAT